MSTQFKKVKILVPSECTAGAVKVLEAWILADGKAVWQDPMYKNLYEFTSGEYALLSEPEAVERLITSSLKNHVKVMKDKVKAARKKKQSADRALTRAKQNLQFVQSITAEGIMNGLKYEPSAGWGVP